MPNRSPSSLSSPSTSAPSSSSSCSGSMPRSPSPGTPPPNTVVSIHTMPGHSMPATPEPSGAATTSSSSHGYAPSSADSVLTDVAATSATASRSAVPAGALTTTVTSPAATSTWSAVGITTTDRSRRPAAPSVMITRPSAPGCSSRRTPLETTVASAGTSRIAWMRAAGKLEMSPKPSRSGSTSRPSGTHTGNQWPSSSASADKPSRPMPAGSRESPADIGSTGTAEYSSAV